MASLESIKETFRNHGGKIAATATVATVLALTTTFRSFEVVESGFFGARVQNGQLISDQIKPGLHWKRPILDTIYELRNNTIIIETEAGTGKNTHEQNMMKAKMRFHYQIDTTQGVLALHIDDMASDNGKELLEELIDKSFDAVVGERHSMKHMADPQALLKAFTDNLEWRLKQNNVPIRMDAAELLTMTIGNGTNPYRVPVQLRIRREENGQKGWAVEQMAGPASVSVPQAGAIINPAPSGM